MRRTIALTLAVALVATSVLAQAPPPSPAPGEAAAPAPAAAARDAELEAAANMVREGRFGAALLALDAVIKRLKEAGGGSELARAHMFLAAAYVGLDQRDSAEPEVKAALALEPRLSVTEEEYPFYFVQYFRWREIAASRVPGRGPRAQWPFVVAGIGAVAGAIAFTGKEAVIPGRVLETFSGQVLLGADCRLQDSARRTFTVNRASIVEIHATWTPAAPRVTLYIFAQNQAGSVRFATFANDIGRQTARFVMKPDVYHLQLLPGTVDCAAVPPSGLVFQWQATVTHE